MNIQKPQQPKTTDPTIKQMQDLETYGPEEVKKWMDHVNLGTISNSIGLLVRTIYDVLQSGMRRSEVVGLSIQDVNLVTRCVRVTGKGSIKRKVMLSSEACCHIKQLLDTHPRCE